MPISATKTKFGVPTSPGFAALCERRSVGGTQSVWCVTRNGTIIEQSQILTTHNLAAVFTFLDLRDRLGPKLSARCTLVVTSHTP